ncbi:BZ3500_MvSof-1268-A1-R1_Chr1-3g02283 [Microbotryum saponariae]|uniref:BZ3500_MvSof-1268-A1-R1_Chr1-3g02283 protein n=1 Tax=Microbotryum saponariae TaxID=289078 RepID=A0A2X0KU58_9BASI|nr:BZ3500_MvSof-1268-A1-R1_Chr1-3g02283 [Microbotryum saponariae]SCZ95868.1 BZ3501_MvSof-1269-A2-R1_Chr1-3g01886 [Microbotryum saponariae]
MRLCPPPTPYFLTREVRSHLKFRLRRLPNGELLDQMIGRVVGAHMIGIILLVVSGVDRCVPHSQDYLPADEVADREFHLAGRSQLLAAHYETLDVARLEPFAVLCTNRAPTVFIQCLAFVAKLPIVIPPTIPVYHQEVRTLFRLDQSLALEPLFRYESREWSGESKGGSTNCTTRIP